MNHPKIHEFLKPSQKQRTEIFEKITLVLEKIYSLNFQEDKLSIQIEIDELISLLIPNPKIYFYKEKLFRFLMTYPISLLIIGVKYIIKNFSKIGNEIIDSWFKKLNKYDLL